MNENQRSSAKYEGQHHVTLSTNENVHFLFLPGPLVFGSSVNGGELLFLAFATCYCNDIYREAARRNITVERVEVEVQVQSDFGAEGEPAQNVIYRATVTAKASEEEVRALMIHTDRVAEIQNTLRVETPVALTHLDIVTV
ncbi:MAG: OsmC family protein [Armatimonadetes bacterium]|nr:OsmC family protein [Armatimonadota bacterium]MDW8152799.1 OsmC family protein [Armatimonadota bacterium]